MQPEHAVAERPIENVVDLDLGPGRPRDVNADEWSRYAGYMSEIFGAFGMDLDTPGTRSTPMRFLDALYEATSGYDGDPKLSTTFPAESRGGLEAELGQIVEGPISFHALCEHHALPFHGVAYVGYIPDDRIIGISKLTRIVRLYARRFTVQERIGEQIADTLVDLTAPLGVAVHLTAEHLCTHMRGVEEASSTITTFWRGSFRDADLRREFLDEVRGRFGARNV
jgi:GTP cyclohydrolase I